MFKYSNSFKDVLKKFNVLNPSIEPIASGHITEQISIIEDLLEKNLAYISNGSVYAAVDFGTTIPHFLHASSSTWPNPSLHAICSMGTPRPHTRIEARPSKTTTYPR